MAGEVKEEKEEILVMVGDGSEAEEQSETGEKVDESEGEEGKEKVDARSGHAEGEEEGEDAEKTTARQDRQKRKQRQREARERNERELAYLRGRNEQLERKFSRLESGQRGTQQALIESRMQSLKSQIETAKDVEAKAIENGNGADTVEAREIREDLEKDLEKLQGVHERLKKPVEREETDSRTPPPEVQQALDWMKRNPWFKPNSADQDSAIATGIENAVLRSGKDPRTSEYWEEVDRRLKKVIPHVFESKESDDADDDEDEEEQEAPPTRKETKEKEVPRKKSSGPKVSVGGRERPLKPNEVYVSPERRAALEELGVWEDPKLRARYLRSFQKYDREESSRN